MRLIVLAVGVAVIMAAYIQFKIPKKSAEISDEEFNTAPIKKIKKRTPASHNDLMINAGRAATVRRVEGNTIRERGAQIPTIPFSDTESADNSVPEKSFAGSYEAPGSNEASPAEATARAPSSEKKVTADEKPVTTIGGPGEMTFTNVGLPGASANNTPSGNGSDGTSGGATAPKPSPSSVLSCSVNYGGGAYSNPIAVSISCSSGSAEVSYCLSKDVCCDPETSGLEYTSAVVVGAKEGNYCLSFYAEKGGQSSPVTQISYAIDNTYPHLYVTHPKVVYQTTQLAGSSLLASNDFSKVGYFMGQVNLKSHNPNPDGLDLDCDEIMDQYAGFSNPMTSMILTLYDMMGLTPSSELEVPLNLTELDYGENYITSYVVNQNYHAPLYSCSTTMVTLSDFDLFQTESAHWSVGDTGMQEFSGRVMAIGVYEDGSDSFRAPASVADEADLKTGLFEVVY